MPTRFEDLHQRLSDPILTLLTLMLSFLLFVIGPMQATVAFARDERLPPRMA